MICSYQQSKKTRKNTNFDDYAAALISIARILRRSRLGLLRLWTFVPSFEHNLLVFFSTGRPILPIGQNQLVLPRRPSRLKSISRRGNLSCVRQGFGKQSSGTSVHRKEIHDLMESHAD